MKNYKLVLSLAAGFLFSQAASATKNVNVKAVFKSFKKAEVAKTTGARSKETDMPKSVTVVNAAGDSTTRTMYTYDDKGRVTASTFANYNAGKWNFTTRDIQNYDAAGHNISTWHQVYKNNQWVTNSRDTSVFDDKGSEILNMFQQAVLGDWETLYGTRTTYTYNANGRFESQIVETLDSTEWIKEQKIVGTFNPDGTYKDASIYNWSDSTADWELMAMLTDIKLKDNKFELPEQYVVKADIGNGTWISVLRYTATYTSSNKLSSELQETFNFIGWQNQSRTTIKYDVYDNETSNVQEMWKGNAWSINTGYKHTLTYNNKNNVTKDEIQAYNTNTSKYELDSTLVYDYGNITGIFGKAAASLRMNAYPNPAQNVLNLNLDGFSGSTTLMLMDISGRVLQSRIVNASNAPVSLDMSALSAGSYMLKAVSEKGTATQAILKN